MKQLLLSALMLLVISGAASAQASLTYKLEGNLLEATGRGPALTVLDSGRFIRDTLDCGRQIRPSWHFPDNAGLQFNNRLANNWLRKTYTIELFFKMSDLGRYDRVVDFKNRTTDKGAYIYYQQLNFYNIATSDTIAFAPNTFGYYVITRDSATQRVRIYSSGRAALSFIDSGEDAVLDTAQKLTFFQDDLIVQNEASPGNVALISLYRQALDSVTVFSHFTNICSILSVDDEKAVIPAHLSPNPAHSSLAVSLDPNWVGATYQVVSMSGATLKKGSFARLSNQIDVAALAPGLYVLHLRYGSKTRALRFNKE